MVRFLLVLLAVLVVGLAVLFGRPWLYVATGLILLGGLGGVGWWLWSTYQQDQSSPERPSPAPDAEDPSLDDLGIMDIQPHGAGPDAPDTSSEAPSDETAEPSDPRTPHTAAPTDSDASAEASPTSVDTPQPSPATDASAQEATDEQEDEQENAVFAPLLEAARAALDAQTVGLLVQEDVALSYRIEALASRHPSVRKSGSFDTQTPLLTATMSRASVTYRSLTGAEVAVEDLGYYDDPPTVDHLALAPVVQPDASSTTFLVADAPSDVDLGASRARTVLSHFADTMGLLLDTGRSPGESDSEPSPQDADAVEDADAVDGPGEIEDADMLSPSANGTAAADAGADPDSEAPPRPRRELIAEAMEAAQSASEPLALALVHLNRAESIARQGEEAVASAERLFQARLEQKAPTQRVERFGELTYGIFFRAGTDTIEPWIADFEAAMAQEEGQLEGGACVGVAVWTDETPEALRTAATEALREAYETGTCTIVT